MTSTKVRRRSPLAGFLVFLTVAVAAALLLIGFWPGPVRAETGPKRFTEALVLRQSVQQFAAASS